MGADLFSHPAESNLGIPVPSVLAYCSRVGESELDAECIIMEKEPGIELARVWDDIQPGPWQGFSGEGTWRYHCESIQYPIPFLRILISSKRSRWPRSRNRLPKILFLHSHCGFYTRLRYERSPRIFFMHSGLRTHTNAKLWRAIPYIQSLVTEIAAKETWGRAIGLAMRSQSSSKSKTMTARLRSPHPAKAAQRRRGKHQNIWLLGFLVRVLL